MPGMAKMAKMAKMKFGSFMVEHYLSSLSQNGYGDVVCHLNRPGEAKGPKTNI